jgi:hypothetical protein
MVLLKKLQQTSLRARAFVVTLSAFTFMNFTRKVKARATNLQTIFQNFWVPPDQVHTPKGKAHGSFVFCSEFASIPTILGKLQAKNEVQPVEVSQKRQHRGHHHPRQQTLELLFGGSCPTYQLLQQKLFESVLSRLLGRCAVITL